MHTGETLHLLEVVTRMLSQHVQGFLQTTCTAFKTVETSKEYSARLKRIGRQSQRNKEQTQPAPLSSNASSIPDAQPVLETNIPLQESPDPEPLKKGRRPKTFNINTYKYHALGDYAVTIRQFGTTDSYSTERVSLCQPVIMEDTNGLTGRTGTQASQIMVSAN